MKEDLIDNESISNHQVEQSISNGRSFNTRMMMMAGFGIVLGTAMILSGGAGYIIGPIALVGSLFILTSTHGVDICYSTNYVREYHKRFGFKSGKWLPMSAFSDIVILKISKTKTTSDITGVATTNLDASKNEVFLMTHDHRKRFLLKTCNSYKEATSFAEEMAEKLDKKIAAFSPKLTKKTKSRLKRGR